MATILEAHQFETSPHFGGSLATSEPASVGSHPPGIPADAGGSADAKPEFPMMEHYPERPHHEYAKLEPPIHDATHRKAKLPPPSVPTVAPRPGTAD